MEQVFAEHRRCREMEGKSYFPALKWTSTSYLDIALEMKYIKREHGNKLLMRVRDGAEDLLIEEEMRAFDIGIADHYWGKPHGSRSIVFAYRNESTLTVEITYHGVANIYETDRYELRCWLEAQHGRQMGGREEFLKHAVEQERWQRRRDAESKDRKDS